MHVSCPNCQCAFDAVEALSPEAIRCPDCGSTFRLEPDKTGPWITSGSERQSSPVEIGQIISHYRLGDRLGGGGMGVVYQAHDTRLGRPVAVKFLPEAYAKDPRALERFQREARTASALNHPHICTIYDIDEYQGQPFLIMELIEGRTLRALVGQRPALATLAEVVGQAAKALAVAHAAGIVHRDIKPENVMVRADGYVKVLDFGLARRLPTGLASARTGDATQPGVLLGTVRYMSPEQARGETATSASDIFALGIVLYELAVGQHPFPADSQVGVLHAIVAQPPLPPTRLNPEIPVVAP
jgi:eukaryotic-like serine/threonine-protein kinase